MTEQEKFFKFLREAFQVGLAAFGVSALKWES